MPQSAELHAQVDELKITSRSTKIAVHALIDLGIILAVECAVPDCRYESRSFEPGGAGRGGVRKLSLDHIILRCDGGSDLPMNVRLAHSGCNSGWATGRVRSDETRARISAANSGPHIKILGDDYVGMA